MLTDLTLRSDIEQIIQAIDRDALRSKKTLVTGGAGFIGSWLCDTLVSSGAKVDCLDNFSTGFEGNIQHLLKVSGFTLKKLDVTKADLSDGRYNVILHFASRASPEEYQQHPIETLMANAEGTRNALETARTGDSLVAYASSSEVYGSAQQIPIPETYWGNVNPIGLRSCYDEGKRYGEALCMAYSRTYQLDVRIVRIFNTYGPRIRADGAYARAVPRFIRQALSNEEITVFGDGSQTRSFCYITDTIAGILRTVTCSAARGQVLNIGSPAEITISDLARTVKRLTRTASRIVYKPLPPDDPKRRRPDISKARELLSWSPEVSLEDGLARTISWVRNTITTRRE
jgi:UDP-glucuronate decarboxylase